MSRRSDLGIGRRSSGKMRLQRAERGDQHTGGRLPRIRRLLASYDATSAWDAITQVRNANAPEWHPLGTCR
jgi:hypothetical protein